MREVALGPGGYVEGVANACTRRVDRTVTDGQEGNSGSGRRHQRGAGTRHGMLPWEGVGPLEEPINQGESLIPRRRRTPEFVPNSSTSRNTARGRDETPWSSGNLIENAEPSQNASGEPTRRAQPKRFGEAGSSFGFQRRVHEHDVGRVGCQGRDVGRP